MTDNYLYKNIEFHREVVNLARRYGEQPKDGENKDVRQAVRAFQNRGLPNTALAIGEVKAESFHGDLSSTVGQIHTVWNPLLPDEISLNVRLPSGLLVGLFQQLLEKEGTIFVQNYGFLGTLHYARQLLRGIGSPYFKALCSAKLASALYFAGRYQEANEAFGLARSLREAFAPATDDARLAQNISDEMVSIELRVIADIDSKLEKNSPKGS